MNDVQKTSTQAKQLIKNHQGYIACIDSNDDTDTYSKLTVRIRQKSIPGPIVAVGKGAWWGIKKLVVLK